MWYDYIIVYYYTIYPYIYIYIYVILLIFYLYSGLMCIYIYWKTHNINIYVYYGYIIGLISRILELNPFTPTCPTCGVETDAPTSNPSIQPTKTPSASPIKEPTSTPSQNPTQFNCFDFLGNRDLCTQFDSCCFCEDPTFWQAAG